MTIQRRSTHLNPLHISMLGHMALIVVFATTQWLLNHSRPKQIDFVVTEPVVESKLQLNPPKETEIKPENKPVPVIQKQVFGVSRNAVTTTDSEAVDIKQGNTVAKENDQLKLDVNDPDSLPIPADEVMITQKARLLTEVKANRTQAAREAGYTGESLMLILIDKTGKVREVKLLNHLEYGLDDVSLNAARSLQFKPAMIADQAVATQIRFKIIYKSSN